MMTPVREEQFVDQLLTSLKIISMIKEGQKVCVRNGLLTLEPRSTGLVVAIKRWIHNDNRQVTIQYVKNIITSGLDVLRIHGDPTIIEKLKQGIIAATIGLNCLSITYSEDATVTATVEVLIERIDLIKNSKRIESTPHSSSSNEQRRSGK